MSTSQYITTAERTFAIESKAIEATRKALDELAFARTCDLILSRTGRVIVMGIGTVIYRRETRSLRRAGVDLRARVAILPPE